MNNKVKLTKTQLGIYIESINNPKSTLYNIPLFGKLPKGFDVKKLKRSIEKVAKIHPALNSHLEADENGDIFLVINDKKIDVKVIELTEEELKKLKPKLVRPFKLLKDNLSRFEIYVTPKASYLFEDFHHIISDMYSIMVLSRDLGKAYRGEEIEKEKLSIFDISKLEEEKRNSEIYNEAKEFYRNYLKDSEDDTSIAYEISSNIPEQGWLNYEFSIDPIMLKNVILTAKTSITGFFTSVFGFLVAKYNYSNHSTISTVFNGRNESGVANTISMFVQTFPFVTDLNSNPEINTLLGDNFANMRLCRKDAVYSFAEMAEEFGVSSDINFAFQGKYLELQMIEGFDAEIERIYDSKHVENSSIIFELFDTNEGKFRIHLGYRKDRYSDDFAKNLCKCFAKVSNEFLTKKNVNDVELVDKELINDIEKINKTEVKYDDTKTVIDLFRDRAKENPNNIALCFENKKYTYRELDELTDRIAKYIKSEKLKKEDIVGIYLPRCDYSAILALSVLKANCAYLPIDDSYPNDRINFMIKDSNTKLIFTKKDYIKNIENYDGKVCFIEEIDKIKDSDIKLVDPKPKDLFVILYTSGSTGIPKGVLLEHKNILAMANWITRSEKINNKSKVANYASFGFDAHLKDFYTCFIAGAELHIISSDIRLNLLEVQKYFNKNQITHSVMTTQVGRQFALIPGTKTLKHLTVGGEKLVPLKPPKYNFYNAYGPTECTVLASFHTVDKKEDNIPIGKPGENIKLYVVDNNGKLLPKGAVGELWISGNQVSRGYLNRPQVTRKAFTKNPFSSEKGYERVYHTGDVVRFLEDGNVQFVGRKDSQVKIRGFRIELTEIENVILEYPDIKNCTVIDYTEQNGEKYLVAYIVSDKKIDVQSLNDYILQKKPPYMVPSVTMQIDQIPMNQNQKVDKRLLPEPQKLFENVKEPQNETQKRIFKIVSSVIGQDSFGVNTNIFMAGLSSIGTVRLIVLLSKEFNVVVQTKDIIENNTIEKLEKFLSKNEHIEEKIKEKDEYDITKTQAGILVECMANLDSTIYNIPMLIELDDGIDLQKLKKAITSAVNAHPFMKTTFFVNQKGDFKQKRNKEPFLEKQIKVVKVDNINDIKNDLIKPFELIEGELFKLEIIKSKKNYLFMDIHHAIADGTSIEIFINDVNKAYNGEELIKEEYSGYDVVETEKRLRNSKYYTAAKNYYKNLFEGCDSDCLPISSVVNGDVKNNEGEIKDFYLEKCNIQDILDFCDANKISLNGFFTSAFGLLISKYCGKEKSVFTTIYNGRNDSRMANTFAMLVKTLPVLCDIDKEKNVVNYANEIGEQFIESMTNDIYSFAEISKAFGIPSDIIFDFQGRNFKFDSLCGKPIKPINIASKDAKVTFLVSVYYENDKIAMKLEYRKNRYDSDFANGFAKAYEKTILEFLKNKNLGEISVLSEENEKELEEFNDTTIKNKLIPMPKLLENMASKYPNKTAVISNGYSLTYDDLNKCANKIANMLVKKGVKPNEFVGVYINRIMHAYSIRQGIMKSGAAFVTIVPEYPNDRIKYILNDSKAKILITTKWLYDQNQDLFKDLKIEVVFLEDIFESNDLDNPNIDIKLDSICYSIYTSGSTGNPKGVIITHKNLANMLVDSDKNSTLKIYKENAKNNVAVSAFCFDASILEENFPLSVGNTVVIANEEEIHNPNKFVNLMIENDIEMIDCTPTFLNGLFEVNNFKNWIDILKEIELGAEQVYPLICQKLRNEFGYKGVITNNYGPTETTVQVATKIIDDVDNITIGKPINNTKMYIIDNYKNILPNYALGELVICGESVGNGYIGLEEKNKESFIEFNNDKAYLSGDLAYINKDNEVVIIGRKDNQIKLRGLRIEIEEIEKSMVRFDGILQAAVSVIGEGDTAFLCGYYVSDKEIDEDTLIKHMKTSLADYMIPNVFIKMDKFPVTVNGKIDKKALPKPELSNKRKIGKKPADKLEAKICTFFADTLQINKVYADDDFFMLGGTSILASKIVMKCMNANLPISYSDIFDNPTPEKLAMIVRQNTVDNTKKDVEENEIEEEKEVTAVNKVLKNNSIDNLDDICYKDIGNVLICGAKGFLAIHIMKELIERKTKKIYCLFKKSENKKIEDEFKEVLNYYFKTDYSNLIGKQIILIDGDITDDKLYDSIKELEFDTIINCAAIVKHFTNTDIMDKVNYYGVKNLVDISLKLNKKFIQTSTVSVAGESVNNSIPLYEKFKESDLYIGQSLENKYANTKFMAEKYVLESVANKGLRAKIIRFSNLMSRYDDGKFQINFTTNSFMNNLKAFYVLGCFPFDNLDDMVEFSPIDEVAKATILLSGTPDKYTVFHAYNGHNVNYADIIECLNNEGLKIDTVTKWEFLKKFNEVIKDESKNVNIMSLIAYAHTGNDNIIPVGSSNAFTVKALHRLGFNWPIIDKVYLEKVIKELKGLGFFNE